MQRRDVLRIFAAGAVLPVFSPELFALFRQAQPPPGYKVRTLTPHLNETVIPITEQIIPATDTPGTQGARVNEFIDIILPERPTPHERSDIIVARGAINGYGIRGGGAEKELNEKGLNTLSLEAGRPMPPEKDYVEHVPVWELKYRDWDDRKERQATQPIQRECYYACDEFSNKFFVKDSDNPYTSEPGKHFSWIKGRQVGVQSITWGRQSYRWSDLDFEANAKEGIAIDWPIRYADIAPWYDYVEEFAGISGQAEGLPQLPDGKFLPR